MPLELKRDTLAAFKDRIDVLDLPKIFQDSVEVTRKFEIRYLWIDSLCILQDKDDLSEWKWEAVGMYESYSNSLVTIAASAAISETKGMLQDRNLAIA